MDLITGLPAKARTFVDDSPWLALGTAVVLVLITRMLAQTVRSRAVASRLASRARMKRAARDAKRAARDVPALLAALPDAARCDEILALTATELRDALRDRKYTSVEVTTLYVDVCVVCARVCASKQAAQLTVVRANQHPAATLRAALLSLSASTALPRTCLRKP